jgi:glyoxalase family protein
MPNPIAGLHHVTAIASHPQRTVEFYTEVLGLRLVKKTVNFDDPETYHLYFGDDLGSPGTIITFFPWVNAPRGSLGTGETAATAFSVPAEALAYWEKRLQAAGVPAEPAGERFGDRVLRLNDLSGMRLELIAHDYQGDFKSSRTSDVPSAHAIRGFHSVTLFEQHHSLTAPLLESMGFEKNAEDGDRIRYSAEGAAFGNHVDVVVQPSLARGRLGAGSVHHIAFRVTDDADQLAWREHLLEFPLFVTDVRDREYFHSIYFREPGGVLFELATDPPGFTVDEPAESLGEALKLPPWFEADRSALEQVLPALKLPHQKPEFAHE